MKQLFLFFCLLLCSISCYSNDTTYTRKILRLYSLEDASDAIYLEFKTLDYNVKYKRQNLNRENSDVDDGTLNYQKNILPYLIKYSDEVLSLINCNYPNINGSRIKADINTIRQSRYNSNGICGVFIVEKNKRLYKAYISFDVFELYYKKE